MNCHLKFAVHRERALAGMVGQGKKNFLRQKTAHDLVKISHSTHFGCTSIIISLDGVFPLVEMSFEAGKRKSCNRSLISFSPASRNSRHSKNMNKGSKFLKKLWRCVGGEYYKKIWFYQLG